MATPMPPAAQKIRFLLLDCDGVLTDGGIIHGSGGQEFKRFDVQDGMGVSLARRAGIKVGVITGRTSDAVAKRAEELHLDDLIQGAKDKVAALEAACGRHDIALSEAAYMGDDIQDLAILKACGLALAPANARPEVRAAADYVAAASGGRGAVREVIEELLKAHGKWADIVADFAGGATPP